MGHEFLGLVVSLVSPDQLLDSGVDILHAQGEPVEAEPGQGGDMLAEVSR